MGAVVYEGGVMFRVWAPHAERVLVSGDFNGWSQTTDELRAEGGGSFGGCVAGAKAGDGYKFVLHRQGQVSVKADPRARQVLHSNGASVVVDPRFEFAAAFEPPPFREQILYELHVGTFNDQPGGGPGTFRSAVERLDHLQALGVNMIELLPPTEFSGDFSWGYNPAFPFAPETAYGSPVDLAALIDAAHARGIGVIIDVVHNHWGPQDLAMWCWAGECLGAGGVYFFTDWRGQTDWGPRPDYGRAEVRRYILDSALAFLDDYRADGLRWDSTVNIHKGQGGREIQDGWKLLQEINDAIDQRAPGKIQIAEDLQGSEALTRPTAQGGAGFDAQWEAGFFRPVDEALVTPVDGERNLAAVRAAIAGGADPFARVIYTESHDEVANGKQRIPSMIDPGKPDSIFARKRSTLGAALVLTSPGVPMLFQGQELLEDGWFSDTDPVDWAKADRYPEVLALYRDLIALRRNREGKTGGLQGAGVKVFHLNDPDKVIAYHRFDKGGPGDDVVVVANFSNRDFPVYVVGLPAGGVWKVRLDSDSREYGADYGGVEASAEVVARPGARDGLPFQGEVRLGRYSAVVLSQ
jgi:1,4-alpha-glucan branching enzyme